MSSAKTPPVIFLIVSERSGANLLLNMVAMHPDLCAPLPPHFFRHLTINRARYGDLSVAENWHAFLQQILDFSENISEPWSLDLSIRDIDERVCERTFEEAFRVIIEEKVGGCGAKLMLLKENEVFSFMPALLVAFPESCFVWQVRDPRDVMASFKRSSLFMKLMPDPVGIWNLEQRQTLNVYPFLKERGRIHFQRYEDLIADPESVLRKLCGFFGVSYNNEMLDFHKNELSRKRAKTSDLRKNVARPVIANNTAKFRDELTVNEIVDIENRVGDLMEIFGYAREYTESLSKEEELRDRRQAILEDSSTTLEDRKMRVARIDVIRNMLLRPYPTLKT